MIEEIFIKN